MSKIIKRFLISYSKCILGWAGDNQSGKSKQEIREESKHRERPKEQKELKEFTGPRFGKNQTTPTNIRLVSTMIYNTTCQLLTRVKNTTYLRASWGIAGLTFWSKEEKKRKREVKIRLFKQFLTTFYFV